MAENKKVSEGDKKIDKEKGKLVDNNVGWSINRPSETGLWPCGRCHGWVTVSNPTCKSCGHTMRRFYSCGN